MLAPPVPRASRNVSIRFPGRARGSPNSRGTKRGSVDLSSSRGGSAPAAANGTFPKQTRPSSKNVAPQASIRRGSARGITTQRNQVRQQHDSSAERPLNSRRDGLRDATCQDQGAYRKHMERIFTSLSDLRKKERKDAIHDGLLADPDKPTTLANAITIRGTCQDMCAEYERVQRIVQSMVDDCEKVLHSSTPHIKVPLEDRMVKRYRRPAAGYEEQLPSDIRPPLVLQKTLDYLMAEVVGGSEPLAKTHKFVWDRTRAIRNDFSIQQVTKVEELRVAISCFERIARFHILSLHQLSKSNEDGIDFDAYQEREQLNNTLLSLMYYYDDSRHKLVSPNEAEFRAYCIIFEIQDQRPDLEDRAQNWPVEILKDQRVQTALRIYAAAANASDRQGPLQPQASNLIAQANISRFFNLVQSPAVPYLMACVAEIYFNQVRRTALDVIWRAYKVKRGGSSRTEDWVLDDVKNALGFDNADQAQTFCEEHGFTVSEKENGEPYVDLGSVVGKYLTDSNSRRKQSFSKYFVEYKRHGRTLPATINGLTTSQAQTQGLIIEESCESETSFTDNEETLFMPEDSSATHPKKEPLRNGVLGIPLTTQQKTTPETSNVSPFTKPSTFNDAVTDAPQPTTLKFPSVGFFGKPSAAVSTKSPASSPFKYQTDISNSYQDVRNTTDITNLKTPAFTFANPSTSDTQQLLANTIPASRNLFNLPLPSTATPPSVSFATSPLFASSGFGGAATTSNPENISSGTSPLFTLNKPDRATTTSDEQEQKESSNLFSISHPKSSITLQEKPQSPPKTLFPSTSITPSKAPPPIPKDFSFTAIHNSSSKEATKSSTPTSTASTNNLLDTVAEPNPPAPPSKVTFSQSPAKPFSPLSFNQPTTDRKSTPSTSVRTASDSLHTDTPSPSQPTNTSSLPSPSMLHQSRSSMVALPPDPQSALLDELSEALMMEDQGFLQQFVEYTIGPLVDQAFQEVRDERSWHRAREARRFLLGRKYLQRWKNNIWRKKLLRKGRERRRNFGQSMQELAKASRQRQIDMKASFQSSLMGKAITSTLSSNNEEQIPPPSPPKHHLERNSLPVDFNDADLLINEDLTNKRRKGQALGKGIKSNKRSSLRLPKSHQKRSRPMGESTEIVRRPNVSSPLPRTVNFSLPKQNPDVHGRVMQQARRLAGNTKLDTTRGDYFALQARGIDPDTTFIPQSGIKRSRVDEQIERVKNVLKRPRLTEKDNASKSAGALDSSSHISGAPNQIVSQRSDITATITATTIKPDDDSPEALFAQVRHVRAALAEGTAWFQAERQKSERLTSSHSSEVRQQPPSQAASQDKNSQRREWRPRAQIHLEKTKAGGLLPPDWDWNRSVNEWKQRGGVGSPSPSMSMSMGQNGGSTPAVAAEPMIAQRGEERHQKGELVSQFAEVARMAAQPHHGLPLAKVKEAQGMVELNDENESTKGDDEDGEEEEGSQIDGFEEDEEGSDDEEVLQDGQGNFLGDYEDEEYEGGFYEEEDVSGDEEEESEEEEGASPAKHVLQSQGNSAEDAIEL